METLSLREIAGYVNGSLSGEDVLIRQIGIDSRRIGEQCLFIAIKGENTDGHKYLSGAVANGAAAVLVHEEPGTELGVPVIRVENTERALLALASGYRDRFQIPVVAVTGSVGKTTTKDMTAAALGTRYVTLKTAGNQNNQFGMPQTLLRLSHETQAAVIEMGMTGLNEIQVLAEAAKPDTAIITNIGVSHLEQLGTRENILRAKLEVLQGLKSGGTLVLNGDNDLLSTVDETVWPRILRCSLRNEKADFFACDLEDNGRETAFTLKIPAAGESLRVRLPLSGEHNVMDALLALAAASCHGISMAQGARALEDAQPSGLRQKVLETQGITVVADCYNANPDSMKASLAAFGKLPVRGKRVAVLGDMLELGAVSQESHRAVGDQCADAGVSVLLCMGEESRRMAEQAHARGLEVYHYKDGVQLVQMLRKQISSGDGVLFKASHGMHFETLIAGAFPALKDMVQ